MTQKEIDKFLANTKVYVNGKSKEIQEKLFSLGYKWDLDKKIASYTNKPFLFIWENKSLSHANDMHYFINHKYKEITAEKILSIELTESTYRPFKTQEECWQEMLKHQPFGWVKKKGNYVNITLIPKESSYNLDLKNFTFADGTPFGIKEG